MATKHNQILPRNVARRKAELKDNEISNFPKGGPNQTTMHSFITDKKVLDNEECSARNPDGSFVMSDLEVLGLFHDLVDSYISSLPAKCCRGAFQMTTKNLAGIMRVHGQGIKLYQAALAADKEEGYLNDPSFGWDMQNPGEGYPCVALKEDGTCGWHEANHTDMKSGKPINCKMFPMNEDQLTNAAYPIRTCSYTWDAQGNRSGVCDGCKGS